MSRVSGALLGLILAILLLGLSPSTSQAKLQAGEARRVLHVSLYPYIPDAPDAALLLKQGFERQHPDVIVDMTLNPHYYELEPAAKGLLYEEADVHEIDVVFLADLVARHRLAPLSPKFLASLDALMPLAREAGTLKGKLVAVPQWMCMDFLIYRNDKTGLADAHTLAAVEQELLPEHGLLMNMSGDSALGELYFSALLPTGGSPETVLQHVTSTPDPVIMDRLRRILAMEPAGLGRNPDYALQESFYARQFARRVGSAFVGYSELTHDVLEETTLACRTEDRCVTAGQIGVAAFPFADGAVAPTVWVDMFGIDAKVHGRALRDAQDFIRYAVSVPAYRSLLIPREGEIPRYLLPATRASFDDPEILKAAPLYPKFRAILDQGLVVTIPHLSDKLHDVAVRIDAELPKTH